MSVSGGSPGVPDPAADAPTDWVGRTRVEEDRITLAPATGSLSAVFKSDGYSINSIYRTKN